MSTPSREFRIEESPETPLLGLLLGWGPMIPFLFGVAAAWILRDHAMPLRLMII